MVAAVSCDNLPIFSSFFIIGQAFAWVKGVTTRVLARGEGACRFLDANYRLNTQHNRRGFQCSGLGFPPRVRHIHGGSLVHRRSSKACPTSGILFVSACSMCKVWPSIFKGAPHRQVCVPTTGTWITVGVSRARTLTLISRHENDHQTLIYNMQELSQKDKEFLAGRRGYKSESRRISMWVAEAT